MSQNPQQNKPASYINITAAIKNTILCCNNSNQHNNKEHDTPKSNNGTVDKFFTATEDEIQTELNEK